jgi:hypothetical protein
MAKARAFRNPDDYDMYNANQYSDPSTAVLKPGRRSAEFNISKPDGSKTSVGGNEAVPLSGTNRKLFSDDYSEDEFNRVQNRHSEWQVSAPKRFQASKDETEQRVGKIIAGQMPHAGESFRETADRVLSTGQQWRPEVTLPSEGQASPGAGWYFDQNRHYREKVPTPETTRSTIIGGSAMSPRNSPAMERQAGVELASAHDSGAEITIPKGLAEHVNSVHAKGKKPLIPEAQIGTSTPISDIHPDVIATLATKKARNKAPAFYKSSTVDFTKIGKGSPNVATGVKGVRGAAVEDVAPPLSAPKVNTYTQSSLDYHASPDVESNYKAAVSQIAGAPAPAIDKTVRLTPDVINHAMTKFGKGTESFNSNDRAVQELQLNAGRRVHVDGLHPAIVEALSDHPNSQVRAAALSSANHPTVADTWVQAAVAGAPQATLLPKDYLEKRSKGKKVSSPMNFTSVYKATGSGGTGAGYWGVKSNSAGESLLDATTGNAAIKGSALQHSAVDHIVRLASHRARQVLGTEENLPSTGVQESHAWTIPRRLAGKDPEYKKAFKKEGR